MFKANEKNAFFTELRDSKIELNLKPKDCILF